MADKDKKLKAPKEAAKLFDAIIKASVKGNPKPKLTKQTKPKK